MNIGLIVLKIRTIINGIWINLRFRSQLRNGEINIVFSNDWYGFASRFVRVLELLYFCDKFNYKLKILHQTGKGQNLALDNLFVINFDQLKHSKNFILINDVSDLPLGIDCNSMLSMLNSRKLINKYIVFNGNVVSEVDVFCNNHFAGYNVLGVHYRGTDKILEADFLPYSDVINAIKRELLILPIQIDRIFVSSDEYGFIENLKSSFDIPVIYRDDYVRSVDGTYFHRGISDLDTFQIHEDAMINMLLLSKCSFLLKSVSCLSDCSMIFNSDLKMKYLNQPMQHMINYWPTRELLKLEPFVS